jgi:photosystem II stability/assembly factor-like uncharacterized protein
MPILGIISSAVSIATGFVKRLFFAFTDDTLRSTTGNLATFTTDLSADYIGQFWYTPSGFSSSGIGTGASDVAYTTDGWVVAVDTNLVTSPNGTTWTTRTANVGSATINTVAGANGAYVLGTATGQLRYSNTLSGWTTVATSNFGTSAINGIAANDNGTLWIAVGNNGAIRTSTDITTTWTTVTSNSSDSFNSIAYGNGTWVAGGINGTLRTSTDGTTWTTQTSNFGATVIRNVAYGNGFFIAGGDSGQIRTSDSTGTTWTTRTSNFGTTTINSIAYSGSRWVAVGNTGQVRTSTDGVTWVTETINLGETNIKGVAFGNGLFVAVCGEGSAFIKASSGANILRDISAKTFTGKIGNYENAAYFTVGDGSRAVASTDGITWSNSPQLNMQNIEKTDVNGYSSFNIVSTDIALPTSFNSIAYGNGIFVTVGDLARILTSSNLLTWTTRDSGSGTFFTVAYGGGLYLAGGSSGLLKTSTDGITWVTRTSNFGISRIYDIEYGNSLWIASGAGSNLRTSTDGITWTTQNASPLSGTISYLTYGNGIFIATNSSAIYTSTDGVTWTSRTSGGSRLSYANGLFFSGGSAAKRSTDGITWTDFSIGFQVGDVVYAESYYATTELASGIDKYAYSTDAITWVTRDTTPLNTVGDRLLYGQNKFVSFEEAVGKISTSNASTFSNSPYLYDNLMGYAGNDIQSLRYSTNLVTWLNANKSYNGRSEVYEQLFDASLASITSNSRYKIAAYENGSILKSDSATTSASQFTASYDATPKIVSWISYVPFDNAYAYALTYGNGLWVAGADGADTFYTSTDGISWTGRTSNFGAISCLEVFYGNGLYVAVGATDTLRTSTNGTTWVTRTANFGGSNILSGTYGNGQYLITGAGGRIRTSTDATTWTTRTSNSTTIFEASAYGNGYYAVAGDSGVVLSALGVDGTWTTRTANISTNSINDMGYGNGLFVICASGGLMSRSTDSITWTTTTSNFGNQSIESVRYGNGLWVALGGSATAGQFAIRTSTDGITWTTVTDGISPNWGHPFYGNSYFIVLTTPDGVATNTYFIPTQNSTLSSITDARAMGSTRFGVLSNNLFYDTSDAGVSFTQRSVVGTPTTIADNAVATDAGYVYKFNTSTNTYDAINHGIVGYPTNLAQNNDQYSVFIDGRTPRWTTRTSNFGTSNVQSVAYGNSIFVAVGASGQLRTSTDGVTWTTRTSTFGSTIINTVTYGNGTYVAGGNAGQLRTSTDGTTWTTRTSTFGTTNINASTYGNGTYVAGGNTGQLRTSTDGTTWTTRTSNFGSTAINTVTYGNGTYVAAGASGQLRTSTDGTTWTTRTSTFGTSAINSVAYGNGTYIAVGNAGQLRTSTDGTTWTTRTSNFGTSVINSVAYGNSLWVAVAGGSTARFIRTSTDGTTWTTRTESVFQPTYSGNNSLRSINYGNNIWVVGGVDGFIASALTNTNYGVYTSFNGVTWSTSPLSLPLDPSEITATDIG